MKLTIISSNTNFTTAADERTVIQKESAAIRTSFKEENNDDE
ncbi:9271_t:CDS:2, partial [Entrophospora sp. SA101]